MPELPEVECLRISLEKTIQPQTRIQRWVFHRSDLRLPIPIPKLKKTEGNGIVGFHRRAKYLLIELDEKWIVSHLGMSGNWRKQSAETRREHDHVELELDDGTTLIYNDPRRFGFLLLLTETEKQDYFSKLGLEPLELQSHRLAENLFKLARGKSMPVKAFVMDQKYLVGVGNIYAQEALFLANIHPLRKASDLSKADWVLLVKNIQNVLKVAIQRGGSSIRDYRSLNDSKGGFQKTFSVYGREGQDCPQCKRELTSLKIGGRATVWCDSCQT